MAVEKGQILTPDKKQKLIDEVTAEIKFLDETTRSSNFGKAVMDSARRNKEVLQGVLNKLFDKKGVITPQETDDVLSSIENSKKQRLEGDYTKGLKRASLYLVGFLAIGAALYFFTKNKNK